MRRAVDAATRRGIAVMTLVSDLPGSARRQFIGIDNVAAGRTAASLLGRFCPQRQDRRSSPARWGCATTASGSRALPA